MPHLGKKQLKQSTEVAIGKQLVKILLQSNQHVNELLTEVEHLMLAKLLAIILMLEENVSYYRISKTLAVSTSTIKRLHRQVLNDNFPTLTKIIHRKKEREMFWKALEVLSRGGLPPRGRGRWHFLNRDEKKQKS